MHKKRGQVSTFMIIGLIILFAFILIFFLRDNIREKFRTAVSQEEYLSSQLKQIRKQINSCVVRETEKAARELGDSGGYYNPEDYIRYHGKRIAVSCSNVKGTDKCTARPLSLDSVNSRLNERLKRDVKNCINLSPFRNRDYKLTTGEFSLTNELKQDNVIVEVNYPITLKLDENELRNDKFSTNLKIPLGKAIVLANVIISEEAGSGDFDAMVSSLLSNGEYVVRERKSYPHKIYLIDFNQGKYKFNIGIEGS